MRYKFLQNVNYEGTYYNAGNAIDLDERAAATLGELVEKIEPPQPEVPTEPEKVDYSGKTVKELQAVAKEKDIDVKGLKRDEIIEALEE